MMPLTDLLDAWGAALWRASWQGGLAALVVWVVCRLVPSIPARFQAWMWRLVMVKFAVALVWAAPVELPLLPPTEVAVWETGDASVPLPISEEIVAVVDPAPVVSPWWALFLVWSIFAGWQMSRILAAFRAVRRLRKRCRISENPEQLVQLLAASAAARLRRPPALLEMDGQGSPMLIGLFRPAIVLPAATLNRLDDSEQAMVFSHELAHLRRGDLFWSLLANLVRSILFFHPLAWLSERRLRLTQEIAADELAMALQKQDPVCYAALLVSCVSKIGRRGSLPAMSLAAAGASQHSLKQRILAMRFIKPVSRRIVVAYGLALGMAATLAIVPWTLVATEAAEADKAESKETIVSGAFVSFKEGVLKIKDKSAKEIEWKIADKTKVVGHIKGIEKEGTAPEAFKMWEPGAMISVKVKDGNVMFVEIGIKKAPDQKPEKSDAKKILERGKLVSFKDGTLTFKTASGALIEKKISQSSKSSVWSDEDRTYKSKDTVEALNQAKVGTLVVVADSGNVTYIGARKGQTVGTLVSFKDDRLLMLGKDFPESFTKKYGNNVHFKKFDETIPVHESIDGGEYKMVGTPSTVLAKVKEGTIITVHSEGDENFTLIQIGVSAKK